MSNTNSGSVLGASTAIGGIGLLPYTSGQSWLSILPIFITTTAAIAITLVISLYLIRFLLTRFS